MSPPCAPAVPPRGAEPPVTSAPTRGQARGPSVPSPRSAKPRGLDGVDGPRVLQVCDHRRRRTAVWGSGLGVVPALKKRWRYFSETDLGSCRRTLGRDARGLSSTWGSWGRTGRGSGRGRVPEAPLPRAASRPRTQRPTRQRRRQRPTCRAPGPHATFARAAPPRLVCWKGACSRLRLATGTSGQWCAGETWTRTHVHGRVHPTGRACVVAFQITGLFRLDLSAERCPQRAISFSERVVISLLTETLACDLSFSGSASSIYFSETAAAASTPGSPSRRGASDGTCTSPRARQ